MKLWTMPRIVVDVFTPNDSVAACLQLENLPAGTIYWDAATYTFLGAEWKSPDGYYSSSTVFYNYSEAIEGNGTYIFNVDDDAETGWYTSINFYSGYGSFLRYTNQYLKGTYDVYVFSDHKAYLYGPGTYDAVEHATPTAQKNFNS